MTSAESGDIHFYARPSPEGSFSGSRSVSGAGRSGPETYVGRGVGRRTESSGGCRPGWGPESGDAPQGEEQPAPERLAAPELEVGLPGVTGEASGSGSVRGSMKAVIDVAG